MQNSNLENQNMPAVGDESKASVDHAAKSANGETKEYAPTVSWFLRRDKLVKRDGQNGPFYKARVFNGTKLKDGTDISGYTYTFNEQKLSDIKAYDSSPDFIKDSDFREKNGAVYYKEETKITLTEPYDRKNPDKELKTIKVEAKELWEAQRNREKPAKQQDEKANLKDIGTKERVTQRVVGASKAKSDSENSRELAHDALEQTL